MSKKNDILTSALSLLTERGIHNTPMSAIAKEANTGMGTIYNYFPNKETLINEIYVKIKLEEKSVFVDFDGTTPIKTQFEQYFAGIIAFYVSKPDAYYFMAQVAASPIITETSRQVGENAITPIFELLAAGQEQRILKLIAVEELLQFIGGATLSYLGWLLVQPQIEKTSLDNQMKMVWDAITE